MGAYIGFGPNPPPITHKPLDLMNMLTRKERTRTWGCAHLWAYLFRLTHYHELKHDQENFMQQSN